jgi:hypothetical protein
MVLWYNRISTFPNGNILLLFFSLPGFLSVQRGVSSKFFACHRVRGSITTVFPPEVATATFFYSALMFVHRSIAAPTYIEARQIENNALANS